MLNDPINCPSDFPSLEIYPHSHYVSFFNSFSSLADSASCISPHYSFPIIEYRVRMVPVDLMVFFFAINSSNPYIPLYCFYYPYTELVFAWKWCAAKQFSLTKGFSNDVSSFYFELSKITALGIYRNNFCARPDSFIVFFTRAVIIVCQDVTHYDKINIYSHHCYRW